MTEIKRIDEPPTYPKGSSPNNMVPRTSVFLKNKKQNGANTSLKSKKSGSAGMTRKKNTIPFGFPCGNLAIPYLQAPGKAPCGISMISGWQVQPLGQAQGAQAPCCNWAKPVGQRRQPRFRDGKTVSPSSLRGWLSWCLTPCVRLSKLLVSSSGHRQFGKPMSAEYIDNASSNFTPVGIGG